MFFTIFCIPTIAFCYSPLKTCISIAKKLFLLKVSSHKINNFINYPLQSVKNYPTYHLSSYVIIFCYLFLLKYASIPSDIASATLS